MSKAKYVLMNKTYDRVALKTGIESNIPFIFSGKYKFESELEQVLTFDSRFMATIYKFMQSDLKIVSIDVYLDVFVPATL